MQRTEPVVTLDDAVMRTVTGTFFRAVDPAYRDAALEGSRSAARYSPPDVPTLYLSSSRDGVAAATIAHSNERTPGLEVLQFDVEADRIVDLRDHDALKSIGIAPGTLGASPHPPTGMISQTSVPGVFARILEMRGLMALNLAVAAATVLVLVNTVVYAPDMFGGSNPDVAIALACFGAGSMIVAPTAPKILDRIPDRHFMRTGGAQYLGNRDRLDPRGDPLGSDSPTAPRHPGRTEPVRADAGRLSPRRGSAPRTGSRRRRRAPVPPGPPGACP